MTGVSYMIPFVAAGGLLIALGFLFGGYEIVDHDGQSIAVDNTLFNLPDVDELGLDHALFGSAFFAYLGAAPLHPRRRGLRVPGPRARRLHRLRHRRPSRHRPGLRDGRRIAGHHSTPGFLGGIVGGVLAGVVAHWITALEGAHLGSRPDAGAGDPAARDR